MSKVFHTSWMGCTCCTPEEQIRCDVREEGWGETDPNPSVVRAFLAAIDKEREKLRGALSEAIDNQSQLPYEHCDYDLIEKWKATIK